MQQQQDQVIIFVNSTLKHITTTTSNLLLNMSNLALSPTKNKTKQKVYLFIKNIKEIIL